MLATGGSGSAAVAYVRAAGATDIVFVCVVAAPEGLARMRTDHPEVPIVSAALDRELNEHAYILPGLGDFGDRLYGTQ
jgi:uracil phosphoribosyltransferase